MTCLNLQACRNGLQYLVTASGNNYVLQWRRGDVSVKIRHRCETEFCDKLGKSGNETLEMLQQAYGGETLSRAAIFQW